MFILLLIAVLLFMWALDLAVHVWIETRRSGKFQLVREDGDVLSFITSTGRFNIYATQAKLGYTLDAERGSLPFDALVGIEYAVDERRALLMEIFAGFDLTDFMQRYRDTRRWYAITVLARDGVRIPLYLSSRYQRREFMMGWYFRWRDQMLIELGLLRDIEAESRQLFEQVQRRLGDLRVLRAGASEW